MQYAFAGSKQDMNKLLEEYIQARENLSQETASTAPPPPTESAPVTPLPLSERNNSMPQELAPRKRQKRCGKTQ